MPPIEIDGFQVVEVRETGGQGVMYRAERDGEVCAIKEIQHRGQDDYERALREAQILSTLPAHPGLARLLSHEEQDSSILLQLEWVDGSTWQELASSFSGPLPWHWVLVMGIQAAEAVAHLQTADVLHRDLKLANLMVTRAGRTVVVDLGIALVKSESRLTVAGDVVGGTAGYVPPEGQEGRWTARSDVYQIGECLQRCLRGALNEMETTTPLELRKLIHQCTRSSEKSRPKSMRQVVRKLRGILEYYAQRAQVTDPVAQVEREIADWVDTGSVPSPWFPAASAEAVKRLFLWWGGYYCRRFGDDGWHAMVEAMRKVYPVTRPRDLLEAVHHLDQGGPLEVRDPAGLLDDKVDQVQRGEVEYPVNGRPNWHRVAVPRAYLERHRSWTYPALLAIAVALASCGAYLAWDREGDSRFVEPRTRTVVQAAPRAHPAPVGSPMPSPSVRSPRSNGRAAAEPAPKATPSAAGGRGDGR
ncbi:MAG: serine/threonine protein kinase [Candidatus Devosia euplotis]|nr:serine/threonine protein kinase [Candidatus Devosia euplotis]